MSFNKLKMQIMTKNILLLVFILFIEIVHAQTPYAGDDQAICSDSSFMNANQPPENTIGYWLLISGAGSIVNPTICNTLVTDLAQGMSTFRWSFNNMHDDVILTNNSFSAYAGEDQILDVLDNDTYMTATLENGATGQWAIVSGSGDILEHDSPTTFVSDIPSGYNTYIWTVVQNNCVESDQVVISVYPLPNNCYAGENQLICSDEAFLYARDEFGEEQYWSVVSGGGDFEDAMNPSTTVFNVPVGENIYRWTVIKNGITCFDDVTVTSMYFETNAGEDVTVTEPECQLNAEPPGADESGFWTVVGAESQGTFENSTLYNTLVYDLGDGVNRFQWYVAREGCFASDTISVIYDASANLNFTNQEDFNIFPIPANDELFIDFQNKEEYTITIYDITGKLLITSLNNGQQKVRIGIQNLKPGLYYCKIISKSYKVSQTVFVKE